MTATAAVCPECGAETLPGEPPIHNRTCSRGVVGVFKEKSQVEWLVFCKPPNWDFWYQWPTGKAMQKSEALARQAAADARSEYSHYDWKVVRRATTDTWMDL